MSKVSKRVALIILDGWGYSEETEWNAIHSAVKPNWDRYWAECPHTLLNCSGAEVGLPDGQMGNSEVGHMHIGAGRLVPQEFTRISGAIEDGRFFENRAACAALDAAAGRGGSIHILGLLSPGGVHSHEQHILAMMELAVRRGVQDVYVHAFLDGRDTPPKSAAASLARVQSRAQKLGVTGIGSIIGRYYAMDRNRHWERTQSAYELIVHGRADYRADDPLIALDEAYARGESDEFVKATAIHRTDRGPVKLRDGDALFFMNYRADRARQLSRALSDPDFTAFAREDMPDIGALVTLTEYSADFDLPVMFPPVALRNTFGDYISQQGCTQLRIAETEKYAHVTFFFNGGEERSFKGEERILVPSPKVPTYDLAPAMSADEVTDRLVEALEQRRFDAIVCNFANPDMVGHTGNFEATVRAIETIDSCLGRIEKAAGLSGTEILITADHGNAEKMRSVSTKREIGQAHTAHTTNLVPLIYIGRPAELAPGGSLVDLAPSMLSLMGLAIPPEMTGRPLIRLEDCASGQDRKEARSHAANAMQ